MQIVESEVSYIPDKEAVKSDADQFEVISHKGEEKLL